MACKLNLPLLLSNQTKLFRFQWAALQIDAVLRESLVRGMQERLRQLLPKDLNKAYDQIHHEIGHRQDMSYPLIAERAFQWIFFAFEPLSTNALVDFVRKDTGFDEVEINHLLEACCNLLVVNTRCHFSHISAREYFETRHYNAQRPQSNDYGHTSLAIRTLSCVLDTKDAFLEFDRFEEGTSIFKKYSSPDQKKYLGEFQSSSLRYAASFWYPHVAKSGKIEKVLRENILNIFSESWVRAYFNWLHLTASDVGPYHWRSLRIDNDLFSQLHIASVLGLKFVVENLLEQGILPRKLAAFGKQNEIVATACAGQTEIIGLLLKCLPEYDRDQEVESILDNVGLIGEASIPYLWKCGFLHYLAKGDKKNTKSRPVVKERFAIASARNSGINIMQILFTFGDVVEINEKVAKVAAANRIGDKLIKTFLGRGVDSVLCKKNVLKAAVKNERCGDRIVEILLGRNTATLSIEKDLIEAAAQNWGCGLALLSMLLARSSNNSILDGSVIEAAAGNEKFGVEMLQFIFGKMSKGVSIDERILVTAVQNRNFGLQLLPMLLDKRNKAAKLEQGVIEAVVLGRSDTTVCLDMLFIILERSGKQIKDGARRTVVHAAVFLKERLQSQARMLSFLIDLPRPDISHEMCLMGVKLVHDGFQQGKILEILTSAQDAHGAITGDFVREVVANEILQARRSGSYGHRMRSLEKLLIKFLSESEQKSAFAESAVVEAARDFSRRAMEYIVSRGRPIELKLTQKLVDNVIQNQERDEIIPLILRHARVGDSITEEITISIVEAFGEAFILQFLDKYRSQVIITGKTLNAASRNKKCGDKTQKCLQQMLRRG